MNFFKQYYIVTTCLLVGIAIVQPELIVPELAVALFAVLA